MTDPARSHRHRREIHIAGTAEDILTYSIYRDEVLLLSRQGTAAVLEEVRSEFEPLPPGLRATLGSGSPKDRVVAEGASSDPEDRLARAALSHAQQVAALTMKMTRDNLQLLEFSRTVLAETSRQIFSAREEARKEEGQRWQEMFLRYQQEQARPLISGEGINQLGGLLQSIFSTVNKGKQNG